MSNSAERGARFIRSAYRDAASTSPVDPESGIPVFTNPHDNEAYTPAGPVITILARYKTALANNSLEPCPHVLAILMPEYEKFQTITPGGKIICSDNSYTPEIALWAAWKPELLVCPKCSAALLIDGSDENFRCDACGNLAEVLASCTSVIPPAADKSFPALACQYALCESCMKLSKMEEG